MNKEEIYKSFAEKKKPRVEDTHKRITFLVENELLEEFDKLAEKYGRGFKTYAINLILQNFIDHIKEKENKKEK